MANSIYEEEFKKDFNMNCEILAPLKYSLSLKKETYGDDILLQKLIEIYNKVTKGQAQTQSDIANGKLTFIGNGCCVKVNPQPECAPFRWQVYSCDGRLIMNLPSNLPVNINNIGYESFYPRTTKIVDAQNIAITTTENHIVFSAFGSMHGSMTLIYNNDAVAFNMHNPKEKIALGSKVDMRNIREDDIASSMPINGR
ncbi:MAG: hypothetical protein RR334_00650 [Clostridia bacterium]